MAEKVSCLNCKVQSAKSLKKLLVFLILMSPGEGGFHSKTDQGVGYFMSEGKMRYTNG